ncbi:MAG TPA: plasmid maintenance system antidote protein [Saprospirales bacterium]|nr:plasmid maintenance system antidote protein [Saprospirales bacterium]
MKGIHPGAILRRESKVRGLKNNELASAVGEHPQTISSILKEKRGINPKLSIRLSHIFDCDEEYFMMLQACYEVKSQVKQHKNITPDLSKIRKILFWDTDFSKIDWVRNQSAIIKRIFERGNEMEIKEIISFYGEEAIRKELITIEENIQKDLIL